MDKKKYVVLASNTFSRNDWKRFGCEFFDAKGFEVVPIEISGHMVQQSNAPLRPNFIRCDQAIVIDEETQLREILSKIDANDIIVSFLAPNAQLSWVYGLLKEYNLQYAGLTSSTFEAYRLRSRKSARSLNEYLDFKWKDFRSLVRRSLMFIRAYTDRKVNLWSLPAPRWWFYAGKAHSPLEIRYPKLWQAKHCPIHSFDYEKTLEIKDQKDELFEGQHKGGYTVFLDQAMVDHPDYNSVSNKARGIKCPVSAEGYYPVVRKLFDQLEKQTGNPVVVAAHIKASYDPDNNPFERKVFYGETARLVKNSDLVICTCSISVAFATIYNKPILFFTTDEIEQDRRLMGDVVRGAGALENLRINLDELAPNQPIEIPSVDYERQKKYCDLYVKEPQVPEQSLWQMVLDVMSGDNEKNSGDSNG